MNKKKVEAQNYRQHYKYIVWVFFAILGFLYNKYLFISLCFIILDLIISYLCARTMIPSIFDLILVGIVITGYNYSFYYALFVSFGYIINGLLLVEFEFKHLVKFPVLIICAFFSSYLNFMPFYLIAIGIPILKIILQTTVEVMILSQVLIDKLTQRALKLATTIIIILNIQIFF